MKAVQYSKFGGSSVLSVTDVDRPAPKPGHAVVRVVAAALNPIDWKVRGTLEERTMEACVPAPAP
jgi:NADPH:quinone reductase-like Zn-dependent oxidoreductase